MRERERENALFFYDLSVTNITRSFPSTLTDQQKFPIDSAKDVVGVGALFYYITSSIPPRNSRRQTPASVRHSVPHLSQYLLINYWPSWINNRRRKTQNWFLPNLRQRPIEIETKKRSSSSSSLYIAHSGLVEACREMGFYSSPDENTLLDITFSWSFFLF